MTRVGIIETGRPSQNLCACHGDFAQMFRSYFAGQPKLDFSVFNVFEKTLPPKADACEAWLITGSSAGVYDDHGWIPPLMDFVREAMERSAPTFGICFGHQLMAEALGGKVVKSDKGRGIGVHRYDLTEEGQKLVPGSTTINLIAAHQDQIVEAPPGATLLATSAFCPYAAFAYGKTGLSFQGHPEFTPAFERDLIGEWHNESPVPDIVNEAALDTLETVAIDAGRLAPVFASFLVR
jgi:GMP synthase (glutamine-hydrolysing)